MSVRYVLAPEAALDLVEIWHYIREYRPKTKPLQIACILHGRRDVEQVLKGRL